MSDYCAMHFVQTIPVQSISLVDQITFEITATNFSNLKKILINGVNATEYVILSKTKLIVTIPKELRTRPISTVSLLGDSNEAATITFNAKTTQAMNDSIYVLQRFMRILFMRPGSSIFSPSTGSNLLSIIGEPDLLGMAQATLIQKIENAEYQLKAMQPPELSDSKLLSVVNIENISYSVNTLSVAVSLTFTMIDGSTVTADFNSVG